MRVLKKLYPETLTFSTSDSHLLECRVCRNALLESKNEHEEMRRMNTERKTEVMTNDALRSVFMRTKGLPSSALVENNTTSTKIDNEKAGGFSPDSVLDSIVSMQMSSLKLEHTPNKKR